MNVLSCNDVCVSKYFQTTLCMACHFNGQCKYQYKIAVSLVKSMKWIYNGYFFSGYNEIIGWWLMLWTQSNIGLATIFSWLNELFICTIVINTKCYSFFFKICAVVHSLTICRRVDYRHYKFNIYSKGQRNCPSGRNRGCLFSVNLNAWPTLYYCHWYPVYHFVLYCTVL